MRLITDKEGGDLLRGLRDDGAIAANQVFECIEGEGDGEETVAGRLHGVIAAAKIFAEGRGAHPASPITMPRYLWALMLHELGDDGAFTLVAIRRDVFRVVFGYAVMLVEDPGDEFTVCPVLMSDSLGRQMLLCMDDDLLPDDGDGGDDDDGEPVPVPDMAEAA